MVIIDFHEHIYADEEVGNWAISVTRLVDTAKIGPPSRFILSLTSAGKRGLCHCSLLAIAASQHHSRVEQEHCRTIPLPEFGLTFGNRWSISGLDGLFIFR